FEEARTVLGEAVERARAAGEALVEAHARIGEALLRVQADPEGSGAEASRVAGEAIPVLEAAGDHLGLARAYRLRSTGPWVLARFADMAGDAERAAEHARLAGDPGELRLALDMLRVALVFGPLPVAEVLPRLEEIDRETFGARGEGSLATDIPLAMQGRFEEARRVNDEWRAAYEELGRPQWMAAFDLARGVIELLADEPGEAERFLRRGREDFLRIGEKGVLSTLSAQLARALCLQGRFEEAVPFVEESREAAASEDAASQISWRTSMAMVLASRGDLTGAERLAREAVAIGRDTDGLDAIAEALADLAEIVTRAGRIGEAADLLREAVELWERKGNVVSAARARERLAHLEDS
ncbi:MAG TPA: tetratricopeptide repeat protein, partial [Actinomycetota bacterium]|nr:tetratricopeptide repeat protein [Actinomycetota bacterium]